MSLYVLFCCITVSCLFFNLTKSFTNGVHLFSPRIAWCERSTPGPYARQHEVHWTPLFAPAAIRQGHWKRDLRLGQKLDTVNSDSVVSFFIFIFPGN